MTARGIEAALAFRIYGQDGRLMGGTVYAEDAAAMVALLGFGATIRISGQVVWREGYNGQAGESYDAVAEHIAAIGY